MGVVENVKDVVNIIKEIDNIELYRKILDLQSEILDLNSENSQLRESIKSLEEEKVLHTKMVFQNPFYFQENDEIPYCPRCWESDNKTIHLIEGINPTTKKCPQCKSVFGHDRTATTINIRS